MQRTALVTGASRGIGRAIVDRLQEDGYNVIAPDRSELDLSSQASTARFLTKASYIDILVNCAGENIPESIQAVTDEHLLRTLEVNFIAAFRLTRHYAPIMAYRGWGRVVNLSSCYSGLARAGRAPYSASKAALDSLSRAAAIEFGAKGVLINSVSPGFVDTELTRKNNSLEKIASLAASTALGRLGKPSEIAELISFLVSDRNSYITGQCLVIDGGCSIE